MIAGRAAARMREKKDHLRREHKEKLAAQREQTETWFAKFDDGDGVLQRAELAALLKHTSGTEPSDEALDMALAEARTADIKGGGEPKDGISKKSALTVVTKYTSYVKEQKWLDAVFDAYDTNKSGQLEKDQLLALLKKVSPDVEVTEADAAYVLDMVDTNNTGSIDRSEALAACATWKSELASGNAPSQKKSTTCALL